MNILRKFVSAVLGLLALASGYVAIELLLYENCTFVERDLREYCSYDFGSDYLWVGLLSFALFLGLTAMAIYIWPLTKKAVH